MAPREKGVSNTNKNTMYILVAALVIIIVIVGVGAYVFLGGGGVTPPPSNGNGGETVYTMGNATSLKFSVNLTDSSGTSGIYKYTAKNIGTSNTMMRLDIEGDDVVYSYIFFVGNQTDWNNASGTWAEGNYTENWTIWGAQWYGYITHNSGWKTGDAELTYTDSGNSIKVYDIEINPTLDDSVFAPM